MIIVVIGGCESIAATALDFVGMLFCQQQRGRGKERGRGDALALMRCISHQCKCTNTETLHILKLQIEQPRKVNKYLTQQGEGLLL